jgi:hypothetical protein
MADGPENVVLVYARRIDERLAGLEREFALRIFPPTVWASNYR